MKAQDNLALGQWRSLLPYTTGKYVTQTPTEIWYVADRSLVIFDKEELSTRYFDKVDGLSDVDIKIIEYSPENDVFLAVYNNSNIDIISGDGKTVSNMNELKRDIELQGDKSIYDVHFLGDAAYLATGFGVMEINLERQEIGFTTFTNLKVNSVTSLNGKLYAATDEGIYYAPLENFNILDFTAWDKLDMDDNFPDDYSSRVVHNYKDELYVDVNDTLFAVGTNELEYILHEPDFVINYLENGQDKLIVNLQKLPFLSQRILLMDNTGAMTEPIPFGCLSGSGSSAVEDESGRLWIGDFGGGFRMFDPSVGACSNMSFNSPYSITSANMDVSDGVLWVTAGTIDQGWQYGLNEAGCATYDKGNWSIYNRYTNDQLAGMWDMIDVEINQATGVVYIGSFIRGLIAYDGQNFVIHNTTNSPLETPEGDSEGNCRVPGVALDNEGNVWMSNTNVPNPIAVLKTDGTWKTYAVSSSNRGLVDPTIDAAGNKWFTTTDRGIVLFKEDDMENGNNHQIKVLNPTNSELPSDIINDITLDLDDDIWVGTSEGVIIFECGSDVFSSSCRGTTRIVEREDGNNARLLETENVKCIAVDGGNRKWVGTENGVFLLSDDGFDQLIHFTTDNSPLFSNSINDIEINDKTGEVYIATEDGIISYQGDATFGESFHTDVFAFPNPVRPDYEGPIAIRGLPQNATVKITDISGTLIFETQSNGGQAIWDGKDYNGREASSGVYLVFSVNERNLENPEGYVTKILKMK